MKRKHGSFKMHKVSRNYPNQGYEGTQPRKCNALKIKRLKKISDNRKLSFASGNTESILSNSHPPKIVLYIQYSPDQIMAYSKKQFNCSTGNRKDPTIKSNHGKQW